MRHVVPWQAFPAWRSRGRQAPAEPSGSAASEDSLTGRFAGGLSAQFGRTGIVLGLLAIVLGMLIAAQLQSKPVKVVSSDESRRETAAQTVRQLEEEQADLKKTIADLRSQVTTDQEQAAKDKTTLAEINQELERQKALAGMVPLRGKGLRVVLDDSATNKIPASDDPSLYIVHEYQIRDVLNLLWLSGAEAISVNGERVVATTSVYCVGSTILVNDTRLSPPYEILAIGDPVALEAAVNDSANLQSLKSRAKAYGVQMAVSRPSQVQVPAYSGSVDVKYTSPAENATESQPPQGGKAGEK